MNEKHDLEMKELSIALPATINKISALATLLGSVEAEILNNDKLWGIQEILEDIVDDLWQINDVLYPSSKAKDRV